MMETENNDNESSETFIKQVQGEIATDDTLKVNGDINGSRFPLPSSVLQTSFSYDGSGEAEANHPSNETHTNGEVETNNLVPSQENGDVRMDVDNEIINDESMDTNDINGEVDSSVCSVSLSSVPKKISVSDVSDDDSASATGNNSNNDCTVPIVNNENSNNELSTSLNDYSSTEEKSGESVQLSTSVEENPNIDERSTSADKPDVDSRPDLEEASVKTVTNTDDSNPLKIRENNDIEDLAKLGSHGSLEITLIKAPPKIPSITDSDIKLESIKDELIIDDKDEDISDPLDPLKTSEKSIDYDDSVIELSSEKTPKKKKPTPPTPSGVPPRRSSRNLNKTKSYADKDIYIEELDKKSDDEVEEVALEDPLADVDKKKTPKKTTIVVSDTKKLVEIAAGSKQPRGGKKEPTLVIIDTNSILSGKGPIPVGQATNLPQMSITPTSRPSPNFTMSPIPYAKPTPKPPVLPPAPPPSQTQAPTPMVLSSPQNLSQPSSQNHSQPLSQNHTQPPPAPPPQPQPVQTKPTVLPSLTDDMFVVEAPSFIVPYVYEKPPVTPLKEYVREIEKVIKEQIREEKRKRKEDKEKKGEKEKNDNKLDEKHSQEKPEDKDEDAKTNDSLPSVEDPKLPDDPSAPENAQAKAMDQSDVESMDVDNSEKSSNKDDKESKSDTETDEEGKDSDSSSKKDSDSIEVVPDNNKRKTDTYFDGPLGKFFMQIGVNLVQEHVQSDLLRNQKRKRDREGENCPQEVQMAINSLTKTLEFSKENNEPYKLDMKKCKLCNFKTESALVMAHHLETPHMRNYVYRCNFCTMEVRSPHDILFHMEAEHNVRGRLERAPAFHQCPNCPFEDNQKGKLSRHLLSCAKKYKPERNQEPSLDWEPPAKIPRVRGPRAAGLGLGVYQPSLAPRTAVPPVGGRLSSPQGVGVNLIPRGRGRPPIYVNRSVSGSSDSRHHPKPLSPIRPGVVFRPSSSNAQPQVLLPSTYPMANNPLYQNPAAAVAAAAAGATAKLLQQPSISITPLPRQQSGAPPAVPSSISKPGRPPGAVNVKAAFVICEICDGYIKDLEQLRNHMQWIHKVKIHPKMIYNRPPLNCQKCQFRFFTDQGLERHLLGSHGLVTSSMQEAANKGKDGGRCPVCGRVYQWKLLNHVARDHSMSLKPAHLSYKCTVCTATFGMYKQFENHVYSAHSVVAKRVMEKKPAGQQPSTSSSPSSTSQQSDSYQSMKPLKINDEITIIPQPTRAKTKPGPASSKNSKA